MANNIVLTDAAAQSVTFVPRSAQNNQVVYVSAGTSLLDMMRCDLNIKDNGPTNRVVGKLSVPTVGVSPSTGLESVKWTEVGSFDLSSVKIASSEAAENFIALFSSLVASNAVKSLYVDGVRD